ncbi:uncharacterized protein LOC142769309 isoform X2 [Rhipicephalus microplus]|uniref:uncharacterized protein LOC142769309 isoform X2 n=1 Tax=Rhipicephalus microplus TaxID=6941 RepID=UPI003F6B5016
MWRGSMHGGLIWKDCDLLGSFEGTKLPNGWLQGRSIFIRQDTGINNNVPAATRGSLLHGRVQCIKNRAQKTNKYKGTASDCSPAQSVQQQKEHIVMSGAAAA